MKVARWLVPICFLFALLGGCCLTYCHFVHISWGCGIRAKFAELPPDDKEFEVWLRRQPGVVEHTVHVSRDDNIVEVLYIQSRNGFNEPPQLNLLAKFEEMGYKGAVVLPERTAK